MISKGRSAVSLAWYLIYSKEMIPADKQPNHFCVFVLSWSHHLESLQPPHNKQSPIPSKNQDLGWCPFDSFVLFLSFHCKEGPCCLAGSRNWGQQASGNCPSVLAGLVLFNQPGRDWNLHPFNNKRHQYHICAGCSGQGRPCNRQRAFGLSFQIPRRITLYFD